MKKLPRIPVICPQCQSKFITTENRLKNGRGRFCSRSCSCKTNSKRHGHSTDAGQSRTYNSWSSMRSRCGNKNNPKYYMYGGAGISVCERWSIFANFLEDMGPRPEESTIDRIDGTLGYFKENCRWAGIREQQRNIKSNINATFKGKTQCVSEWSLELSINHCTLTYRINAGWGDRAFTEPVKLGNRVKSKL